MKTIFLPSLAHRKAPGFFFLLACGGGEEKVDGKQGAVSSDPEAVGNSDLEGLPGVIRQNRATRTLPEEQILVNTFTVHSERMTVWRNRAFRAFTRLATQINFASSTASK